MLELDREMFEGADIAASRFLDSRTGVFVGASGADYATVVHDLGPTALTLQFATLPRSGAPDWQVRTH